VLEATNGQMGIDMARSHHPDLIIMDIKMPVMDGREAMQILAQDGELQDIPVVTSTASVMKEEQDELRSMCSDLLVWGSELHGHATVFAVEDAEQSLTGYPGLVAALTKRQASA
jgi:CheY-like chemotaxis protein